MARQRGQSSRPPVHKQLARTRRIVLVVAPGAEILDLVGPFQVFTTAATLYNERYPRCAAIYRVEIVACSRQTSFTTNCGLQMHAHQSFRQVRGEIDTLLVAGGSAVEGDRTSPETVQWLSGSRPMRGSDKPGRAARSTATTMPARSPPRGSA